MIYHDVSSSIMMYHDLLKAAITESGWSMREIARRCTKKGVGISQGYLSQLCRGNVAPASDRVNQVLGEVLSLVTNISSEDLILAAYRQKIPPEILKKLAQQEAI